MTDTLPPILTTSAIYEWLENNRKIAVIWSIEDVQMICPDLDDDQAWQVLQSCDKWHDCEHGLTWQFIEATADTLFPALEAKGGDDD